MIADQQTTFKFEQNDNIFWTADSEKPKEGQMIANYLIEKQVIETRCSFLMKAKDVRNDTDKAVKFIKYKYSHTERYQNEVEIMKMIDHPNILKLEFSTVRFPYYIKILQNSFAIIIQKECQKILLEMSCFKCLIQLIICTNSRFVTEILNHKII